MGSKDLEDLREEWNSKTAKYAKSINEFVEKGMKHGWGNAGEEPKQPKREHLVKHVLEALRESNRNGSPIDFKDEWYPAHSPFIEQLDEQSQSIPQVCILPDNSILARIGTSYQKGKVVRIVDKEVLTIDEVEFFGQCPNREYFAFSNLTGITIKQGWNGPVTTTLKWPSGLEGVPEKYKIKPFENPPSPTQLIPFPCGKKVLLVSSEGTFVLEESGATRLLPEKESLNEQLEEEYEENPDEVSLYGLDMEHAAISKDGKYIAVGSQCSSHLVYDENYKKVCDIGNQSEYPHYAIFSEDGETLALNSCHFYNGITIGAKVKEFPGLETESYEEDSRAPIIEDCSRVYAGVSVGSDFIIGDASGYIRCVSSTGEKKWQHFLGSSVGSVDVSADKETLVVSTYAGFLSIIKLNSDKVRPYQIGNANNYELRRWVFWSKEDKPLIW